MKLTDVEKLILHNQYEILVKVDPSQAEDYELLRDCLANGYEQDFEQLLPHIEPPQNTRVYQQVRDILEMFRALTPSAHLGIPAPVRFPGFDGNEETEHYAYANFLIQDRGMWRELYSNDLNTHTPVLEDYLAMLEIWERAPNKHQLSPEEVKAIVALAPFVATHP